MSGKGPSAGTQFEQAIHKLMEVDGDPSKFSCAFFVPLLPIHVRLGL